MELSALTRRQKRIKDWTNFLEHSVKDVRIKSRTLELINGLRSAIGRCFEEQKINEADERLMRDYERQLELLNEEARLHVARK